MYVIEVMPLQRGTQIETLSYFGGTPYPLGTLLKVPVRSREILAMVTETHPVSATKTALRAATFSLRKLPPQSSVQSLSPAYIKTAEALAERYPATVGTILFALLPPEIKNGELRLPHTHHTHNDAKHVPELFQGTQNERHLTYRSLIRETFAHGGSVLIVAPTSADAHGLYDALSVGIEERTIVLTSNMTKKYIREGYHELEDFSKSKLIITTPTHAMIERHDITTVVIESARSPYFKERTKPYLDYREVLQLHTQYAGRRLIYGDLLLRSEEVFAERTDRYQALEDAPKRITLPGALQVVRMKDKADTDGVFHMFAPKVLRAIDDTLAEKGRVFLFAARRGIAPMVGCIDCGYIFRSPQTGAPLSLIRTKKNGVEYRWFVCGASGYRTRAADTCPECGSWRLRERGIGIQQVYDELSRMIPKTPIIQFDHTSASTYKKACFLRDTFYGTKGGIMIGTHMAIPYLTAPITTSVVVNMDALYATPTWRLQEDNLALLLHLREHTTGNVYVQMRAEPDSLITHAKQGSLAAFYDEELELRKMCNYPPFTTFVHLTWQGTKEAVQKTEELVATALKAFDVTMYSAPPLPETRKNEPQCIKYGLVRVAAKDWPHTPLLAALKALPPSIRIVVNPDRIV